MSGKTLNARTDPGVTMSFLLALFQKIGDHFASPILPMDAEYSYVARHREAERIRRSHYVPFSLPRD